MTPPPSLRRLHVVGRKGAGKTTLVCELVAGLTARGFRVATIKHTHHHHELDVPGKDSFRHREAGAAAAGILSPHLSALFLPIERSPVEAERYRPFEVLVSQVDLLLVEGDLQATAPRIEVWRSIVGEAPYAVGDSGIATVVSDETPPVICPIVRRSDAEGLLDTVLALAGV